MAVTLASECSEYSMLGDRLDPVYFDVQPTGDVLIKNAQISQLIVDRLANPFAGAQAIGITISIGITKS